MKNILIPLWGIVLGVVGTFWNTLAFGFILHPDVSEGMRDWEEDIMFVPLGYLMFFVMLAILLISYYKIRKNKNYVISFSAFWVISSIIFVLIML